MWVGRDALEPFVENTDCTLGSRRWLILLPNVNTTPSGTDLSRRTRALISAHWSEITRSLAPPTIAWKWGESTVPHKVKYRWKDAGLIYRAPDGERWMTTMSLWCHIIECADDDEPVGVDAVGQQLLPVDFDAQSGTHLLADTTPPTPAPHHRQVTLAGDTVNDRGDANIDGIHENRRKDPTRASDRERAVALAGQTRLQTVQDHKPGVWEVHTTTDGASDGLGVSAGRVYYPAGSDNTDTTGVPVEPEQAVLQAFDRRSWHVTI